METDVLTDYSKEVRELRAKKYTVRPIRRKGGWVMPDHDSAFMNEGSSRTYTVPVRRGNVLENPYPEFFKRGDVIALAHELGMDDTKDLNINTSKCFWRREAESSVKLDRNGLHLDLSDTMDFIKFLVLRSNKKLIALNWASRFDNGEFKFALVEQGEEMIDKVSNLEEKKKAYIHLGKIDGSANKMQDFLYVYYLNKKEAKRPPANATVDWLKNEIGKIIEEDLKLYLDILEDKDYALKLLIQKSVETGALIRKKHEYWVHGSDAPIGVIEELIEYLDDPKNQAVRMKLMHHVKDKTEA
jgi:hypothetical protein